MGSGRAPEGQYRLWAELGRSPLSPTRQGIKVVRPGPDRPCRKPSAAWSCRAAKFFRRYQDKRYYNVLIFFFFFSLIGLSEANSGLETLPDVISKVKGSVVGVGTYQKTRRPPFVFLGTGFAVSDGRFIATNAHVIPEKIDEKHHEVITVVSGSGEEGIFHKTTVVDKDTEHDLCLLKISGPALSPMVLGNDERVREGDLVAFTGYPIGPVLGLHPVTHRGIVSAITPIAIPVLSGRQLNGEMVDRLKKPYLVFQLDATAYPGNSGSPLYDMKTGHVIGIINRVFVKRTKESAIADPSGITYAIPSRHLKEMVTKVSP